MRLRTRTNSDTKLKAFFFTAMNLTFDKRKEAKRLRNKTSPISYQLNVVNAAKFKRKFCLFKLITKAIKMCLLYALFKKLLRFYNYLIYFCIMVNLITMCKSLSTQQKLACFCCCQISGLAKSPV